MFMLFKGTRPVSNLKFESYEKCRQWARRLLRSKKPEQYSTDNSAFFWRTPSLNVFGYTIRKV